MGRWFMFFPSLLSSGGKCSIFCFVLTFVYVFRDFGCLEKFDAKTKTDVGFLPMLSVDVALTCIGLCFVSKNVLFLNSRASIM